MTKNDKILLTQINNYMGTTFSDFINVNWEQFFQLDRVFIHKNKREVIISALPYMKDCRVSIVERYLNHIGTLSDKDVDWMIYLIGEKLPQQYPYDFKQRDVLDLFYNLIRYHNVTETQFEKIFEPYREDTHGFKETLLEALAYSNNLTKTQLERYIEDFSVDNWQAISKQDLWGMYGIDLFCNTNPLFNYLNYHMVLEYNYIPSNVLFPLFMGGTLSVLDLRFRFEDGWGYILSEQQFEQHQIDNILETYKNSEISAGIYHRILTSQYVEDWILQKYKVTFEKYEETKQLYKKLTEKRCKYVLRWNEYKKRKELKKYLNKGGFTVLKDSNKNEYVECFVQGIYKDDIFGYVSRDIKLKRTLVHGKSVIRAPRRVYFELSNTKQDDLLYCKRVRVYLKDMSIKNSSNKDILACKVVKNND